ncbi:hypothetical protein EG359_22475 (plasmid) [Chryseobacterium joostei]|uniref:Conjugative transposon protein TraO n=1 Tax=Chryseobacterium joostei TaxID=112234 RepID=A0A1N7KFR4_9FLAO|nr:conjugal transfer protein TraO [Chryseobacterium joostei]AZB02427.1 hypothetical protein EG359_22475 [Chryseobacterium joostei]SIS60446.1 Conjugative transposon protein TraO [Chryseobacterium joostei]
MKKRLYIIVLLFIALLFNAQGRRAEQSGIHAAYGFIPSGDSLKKNSFMAIAGYNHVLGDKGFLAKAEVFYHKTNVKYTGNQLLPYEKYGLNISGGYSYEGLYPVFINAYVGAFAAYEKVNEGKERDPKFNAIIPEKVTGFVYGISGSAELEIVLARKISLIGNYTQFYDIKSKFSKSNYAIFTGLKFYIN